jgi:hydroxyethylthiazole kinase-like sugar kinase family protein
VIQTSSAPSTWTVTVTGPADLSTHDFGVPGPGVRLMPTITGSACTSGPVVPVLLSPELGTDLVCARLRPA